MAEIMTVGKLREILKDHEDSEGVGVQVAMPPAIGMLLVASGVKDLPWGLEFFDPEKDGTENKMSIVPGIGLLGGGQGGQVS